MENASAEQLQARLASTEEKVAKKKKRMEESAHEVERSKALWWLRRSIRTEEKRIAETERVIHYHEKHRRDLDHDVIQPWAHQRN